MVVVFQGVTSRESALSTDGEVVPTRSCLMPALRPLIALVVASCGCLSTYEVSVRESALMNENRAKAEPAMLAAARAHGANLLPIYPEKVVFRLPCLDGSDELRPSYVASSHDFCVQMQKDIPGCQEPGPHGTIIFRHSGDKARLVIPFRALSGWEYARLARQGDKLLVLMPDVEIHEDGSVTECECDGMPRADCPSSYAFVIDELISVEALEKLSVPISVEELLVKCKAIAL